jgi:hypothetical protein
MKDVTPAPHTRDSIVNFYPELHCEMVNVLLQKRKITQLHLKGSLLHREEDSIRGGEPLGPKTSCESNGHMNPGLLDPAFLIRLDFDHPRHFFHLFFSFGGYKSIA